jgi:hypothetical protein
MIKPRRMRWVGMQHEWERWQTHAQLYQKNLNEGDNFGEPNADESIILKSISMFMSIW